MRQATVALLCTILLQFVHPEAGAPQTSADAVVYVDRAVLAYDAKRYEEALQELEEALRLHPEYVDALYYSSVPCTSVRRNMTRLNRYSGMCMNLSPNGRISATTWGS